jgi:hypothetical protein
MSTKKESSKPTPKTEIKVKDLKPVKNPKGGMMRL